MPITDSRLVFEGIACQLGMGDRDPTPVRARIVAFLRQRPTLVLLGNAEHLLGIRSDLGSLLDECPELVLLVTSRITLEARSERVIRLHPLDVPARQSSHAELVQAPAVNLFIDRARAAGGAMVAAADLPTIAAICHRLDGLPLAIELAAAWTHLFTPGELLHRLEQRLPLLTRGRHDMPERHQTMRAAIAWSYDLLAPTMQSCLRRICVIQNGAPLTAVCAVLSETSGALDGERALAELTNQSLIAWRRTFTDGESELRILETIREFGVDLLRETGEYAEVARTHAGVMLASIQHLEALLGGPDEAAALRRFDQAHNNVQAALSFSIADGDRDRSLQFVVALWRFWILRGTLAEANASVAQVIALVDDPSRVPMHLWLRALAGAATLAIEQGNLETAATLVDRALETSNSTSGDSGRAETLYAAGLLALQRGDNDRAMVVLGDALEHARIEGDTKTITGALGQLSELASLTGDPALASMLEEQRRAQCRELGDRRGLALSAKNLALSAMYAGRLEDAQRLGNESAAELRALEDTGILAEVVWALGHVAYLQGELDVAAEHLLESRSLRLARGDELNAAKSSGVLAIVEIARGNTAEALALVEAADRPLRKQQDRFGLAVNAIVWGHLEAASGNSRLAARHLNEGGELLLDMKNVLYLPWYLEGLAVLAAQNQEWALAAKLLGAHAELTIQVGSPMPPVRPAALRQAEATTTAALDSAAYEQFQREGKEDPIGLVSRQR
jgi:predicted ATPase